MAPNFKDKNRRETDEKYNEILERLNSHDIRAERLAGEIKRIEIRVGTSLEKLRNHLSSGKAWRILVAGTAITLLLSIFGIIFSAGKVVKTVEILEKSVDHIMTLAHGKYYE